MQQDRELTAEDRAKINPCNSLSINQALDFVKNPVACCERMQDLIQKLVEIVHIKRDDPKTRGSYDQSQKISSGTHFLFAININKCLSLIL